MVSPNRLIEGYPSIFIFNTVSLPERELPNTRRYLEVDWLFVSPLWRSLITFPMSNNGYSLNSSNLELAWVVDWAT